MIKRFLRALGALPLPVVHGVGVGLGYLFYLLLRRRRRTARINLQLCFPELSVRARKQLLRKNLLELGKAVTEISVLWTCDDARMQRLVVRTSGEDKLKELMAQRKGLIIAAPHLGAWELVGLYCSRHYPMASLYRTLPQGDTESNALVRHARERFGARLFPADNSGIRSLYKTLAQGNVVGILPDQVPGTDSAGVFAPFFGIPANTMVLLSRLASKTGAPVVFAYAERLRFGRGYHMHFVSGPAQINDDDVTKSATAVNAMVEHCARALPEQYQWIYKRFRGRPKGDKQYY